MVENLYIVSDHAIRNTDPGTDCRSFTDYRFAFETHLWVKHRISSDGDSGINPNGARISHRDSSFKPAFANLLADDLFRSRQLLPGIDSQPLFGILKGHSRNRPPLRNCHSNDISQIVFILCVAWLQLIEGIKEKFSGHDIRPDVDFMRGPFYRSSITIFDDLQHVGRSYFTLVIAAGLLADDSAIAAGIIEHRRQNRHGRALRVMDPQQFACRLFFQQRSVTV